MTSNFKYKDAIYKYQLKIPYRNYIIKHAKNHVHMYKDTQRNEKFEKIPGCTRAGGPGAAG
jgi:hypothetical protein